MMPLAFIRRTTLITAAAAITLAGCTGGGSTAGAPASSTPAASSSDGGSSYSTSAPASSSSSAAATKADCAAPGQNQDIPKTAPKVDAWPLVNGAAVPVSDQYGPTKRDGDVWSCFAHSPTGALFAAVYIRQNTGYAPVRDEYIPGLPESEKKPAAAEGLQLRGFKFTSYDETTASVDLVYEVSSDGQSHLVKMPMAVHWNDEKWVTTYEDLKNAKPEPVTGLAGFTAWGVQA